MAHDVFVSYSNKDKPVADAVVSGLENEGIRCWFAPRDITPGSSWGESIITAIEGSRIMVIVLSENSNRSNQVVREVERAVANNVIIIPFRIENIDPTGAMAYFLATEHWLDAITPPLENHIQKLIQTILVFQAGQEQGALPVKRGIPKKPERKLTTGIIIASIGVALLLCSTVFILALRLLDRNSTVPDEPFFDVVHLTAPAVEVISPTSTVPAVEELVETPTETPAVQLSSFHVIGKWQTSREARGVFVQDGIAYVANGEDGLRILDVSDLSNPLEISAYDAINAVNVIVNDGVAYVIDEGQLENNRLLSDRVILIDVSDPTTPKLLGEATPEGGFSHRNLNNFAVSEGVVYLTASNILTAIDMTNPELPVQIGQFTFNSNVSSPGVFVHEGTVYMQANRFHVVDFRNPANPVEVGGFDGGWGASLIVVDQVAYVAGWDTGLLILDVSDPARPIKIGQYFEFIGDYERLPKGASSRLVFMVVSVFNDIAYMSYNFGVDQGTWMQNTESGIVAVDVSDPTKPFLLDQFTEFDVVSSVFAVDDVVFVTDRTLGLFILGR